MRKAFYHTCGPDACSGKLVAMFRTILALMFWISLGGQAAAQQEEGSDPGTRLILQDDEGNPRLVLHGVPEEPEPPGEGISVGVRGRYITLPDSLLDSWLLDHTSLDSYSVGLEVGIDGPAQSRIIFGIDYSDLGLPAGNFRAERDLPNKASFTEVDLHLVAFDVSFLWKLRFAENVGLMYGAGLGVGYTPGKITSVDVLPTCQQPVSDCAHWREVTSREQEMPSRVWPLLSLQAGFYWDIVPGLRLRAEAGFRGVIYTGLALRSTFE